MHFWSGALCILLLFSWYARWWVIKSLFRTILAKSFFWGSATQCVHFKLPEGLKRVHQPKSSAEFFWGTSHAKCSLSVILKPSWSHLEAILKPSWGHLEAILRPSWGHHGAILKYLFDFRWAEIDFGKKNKIFDFFAVGPFRLAIYKRSQLRDRVVF